MSLRNWLAKRKVEKMFPSEKNRFWYCGEIYNYAYELQREGKPWKTREMNLPCDRFIINPYSDAGGKIPEVGDIVPCVKLEGWIGFYKVINKKSYSSPGSDFASWDDGFEVDLKLHHVELAAGGV